VAAELDRSRTLIANRLVGDDQPVDEADELEFLPPVSGG
jgi:molybdopterin converting factor small subunit